MSIQRRFSHRPVRLSRVARAGGGLPVATGYAAVFYRPDDPGTQFEVTPGLFERIGPRAFDRALRRDDVRALFNHDPSLVLGRTAAGTCRLSVDSVGLRYEIDLPDTQVARDLAELLARGDVTGSSFAFVPEYEYRVENNVRVAEVRTLELVDVGPVTFPAYPGSSSGLAPAAGGRGLTPKARADLDQIDVALAAMAD